MKSMETKIAEQKVDASMARFESAVNHLIGKVEDTQAQVQARVDHAVETVRRPIEFAKDSARKLQQHARANPEPYISWTAFAIGIYLCYRAIRRDRSWQRTHSWSQLEP